VVARASFFFGFAMIGVTGLIAGLTAIGGPVASGLSLERVSA
jgi:hypothetical protein